jgi:sugar lactone lactonase YvrE
MEKIMKVKAIINLVKEMLFSLIVFTAAIGCSNENYIVETFIEGSLFHGFHGPAFDSKDNLFVGNLIEGAIFKVNTETGDYEYYIKPPHGGADDIAFDSNDRMYWASLYTGEIRTLDDKGAVKTLGKIQKGVNPIAVNKEGRIFTALAFQGDGLFEVFTDGREPIKIMEGFGYNGFDFGSDGMLYVPVMFTGEIIKVDVDNRTKKVVASGFGLPHSCDFDSKGNLYVLDMGQRLYRVDIKTGAKTLITEANFGMDNVAINSKDEIYVVTFIEKWIGKVDVETGNINIITGEHAKLLTPGGLAVYEDEEGQSLYIGDFFAYRDVNAITAEFNKSYYLIVDGVESAISISANKDNVIVSGWYSGSIQRRDRKTGEIKTTISNLNAPYDAIELEDRSILVAEAGTGKLIIISDNEEKSKTIILEGLDNPCGLAMINEKEFIMTEAGSGEVSLVGIVNKNKKVIAGDFDNPQGIALSSKNKNIVYVVESGKGRVVKLNIKSGKKTVIADGFNMGIKSEGSPLVHVISGIAVTSDETIYLSSDINNAVYKITKK